MNTCDPAAQRILDSVRLDVIERLIKAGELTCGGDFFCVSRASENHRFVRSYETLLEVADSEIHRDARYTGQADTTTGHSKRNGVVPVPPGQRRLERRRGGKESRMRKRVALLRGRGF
jgi:hypothetical protein